MIRGGSNGLRAHFTRATCSRSRPYPHSGAALAADKPGVAHGLLGGIGRDLMLGSGSL